jgi:hypothetical protein
MSMQVQSYSVPKATASTSGFGRLASLSCEDWTT